MCRCTLTIAAKKGLRVSILKVIHEVVVANKKRRSLLFQIQLAFRTLTANMVVIQFSPLLL